LIFEIFDWITSDGPPCIFDVGEILQDNLSSLSHLANNW